MKTFENEFQYTPSIVENLEEVKVKFHLIETSEIAQND
jgi:hypothetical protein